jgi:uncharacterized membrane protein YgaE (UPF0421/DUF939 family)
MPMDAVELMVSIDFKNRCATDKMIYKRNLREIGDRRVGLRELGEVADVLTVYCEKQEEMGISPTWIKESVETIDDYIEIETRRLAKEEEGTNSRLETLNRQVKEFEQKEKKRKKNGKRTAKKNAKKS